MTVFFAIELKEMFFYCSYNFNYFFIGKIFHDKLQI